MNRNLKLIYFIVIAIAFGGVNAFAVGTQAGLEISNTASISYDVGSVTGLTTDSNESKVKVAEILDILVTSQDASALQVNPGDIAEVRTFLVTNIGNGSEAVRLSADSTITGSDDFNPVLGEIRIDGDGDGLYVPANDPVYLGDGSDDPVLDANNPAADSITIFILNDIPANGVAEGETGDTQLTATSLTALNDTNIANLATTTPGTQITSPSFFEGDDIGNGPVEAIIGNSQAFANAIGTYVVSSVEIDVRKTVEITDPFTGNPTTIAMPGGTLTYTIEVEVTSGTGTADNVLFTDAIPANTTFTTGTHMLELNKNDGNGLQQLTDATAGDDEGDVGQTTPGVVTVDLGTLTQVNGIQTIKFSVLIN